MTALSVGIQKVVAGRGWNGIPGLVVPDKFCGPGWSGASSGRAGTGFKFLTPVVLDV